MRHVVFGQPLSASPGLSGRYRSSWIASKGYSASRRTCGRIRRARVNGRLAFLLLTGFMNP